MRVMVLVKATEQSEAGVLPDNAVLEAMGKYNEDLIGAGILLAGEGLQPSARGKRVEFDEIGSIVVDGPFSETKELIAGFWLWEVRNMEEALEWARRFPTVPGQASQLEVRPVMGLEDYGDHLTSDVADLYRRLDDMVSDS